MPEALTINEYFIISAEHAEGAHQYKPWHVHNHGPDPLTARCYIPTLQRLVEGITGNVRPFEDPHTALTGGMEKVAVTIFAASIALIKQVETVEVPLVTLQLPDHATVAPLPAVAVRVMTFPESSARFPVIVVG